MNNWQIKDLKGVGDVELRLDSNQRVFTFLGTNGVGKTKTLESLFFYLLLKNLKNYPNYELKDCGNINQLFSELSMNNENVYFDKKDISKSKINIKTENFAFSFLVAYKRIDLSKKNIFGIKPAKDLSQFQDCLLDVYNTAILQDALPFMSEENNTYKWFIDKARFINPYQIEKDNSQIAIESVLKCLHKIDNAFDENFLQINENDNVYLKVGGEVLELSELSSGFLSLVKIIQSIIASFSAFTNEKDLLNVKGVVLIDEIESHLHLEWQVKIIPILKNLFPNTTFYITTHSPLVLSQLNEGEAYLLKRDDDNTVRSHLINSPNTRTLSNVLIDAFGINLNQLKIDNISNIDQSKVKNKLLELLDK